MKRIALVNAIYIDTIKQWEFAARSLLSITVPDGYELKSIAVVNKIRPRFIETTKPLYDYWIENDKNIVSRAWNMGIKKALEEGFDYVLVTNLDVTAYPSTVDELVKQAEKSDDKTVMWSPWCENRQVGSDSRVHKVVEKDMYDNYAFFLVDKKLFSMVGEFDEKFIPAYCEDIDMQWRIQLEGLKHLCCPKARFIHHGHVTTYHHRDRKWAVANLSERYSSGAYMHEKWGSIRGEKYMAPFNGRKMFNGFDADKHSKQLTDNEKFDFTKSTMNENRQFIYDLVCDLKPKVIVELGVYTGCSYFSYVQAIKDGKLKTKLTGIDTWKGDRHTNMYSGEIFKTFSAIKKKMGRGLIMRMKFDDAVDKFKNGSIDILMIDGFHTYEAVKHDFKMWLPKLAKNGLILMHDTNVEKGDFGVKKFFGEIECPKFNRDNEHGLGVIAPKGVKNFDKIKPGSNDAVVYSVVYGDYDVKQSHAVDVLRLDNPKCLVEGNDRYRAKHWKVCPHLYEDIEKHRYSIWIDGNVAVISPEFIEECVRYLGDQAIALFKHPDRDCIYEEIEAAKIQNRLPDEGKARPQLERYRRQGHGKHAGLWAGTVIIRNNRHPRIQEFNNMWWREINEGSIRDQLSLPFVLQKLDIRPGIIPGSLWDNNLIKRNLHQ